MNAQSDSGLRRKLTNERDAYTSMLGEPPPAVDPISASVKASTNCQGLESGRMRDLLLGSRDPAAREFGREIYRLHALLRRTALLVHTIQERTGYEGLDITSRTLLSGLAHELEHEPAVTERRAWATCLASGTGPVQTAEIPPPVKPAPAALPAAVQSAPEGAVSDGKRERLFTWKLIPEPGRPNIGWNTSPYRGVAIVRAFDPVQARTLAANKFAPMSVPVPSGRNPWERKSLVRCELLEEPTYDHVQSAVVVYP